jgi:RHH-type proline utilization regulon transcriptional repressor/proline dehydrogenase/delta 1-pyrroline-5-carboxylate dehydrogenase
VQVPVSVELQAQGYFVSPTIFESQDVQGELGQSEFFGPVTTLIHAKTFEEAIQIANDVDYALTGALYSRSPENIALARRDFEVGNLYINRACTGALVCRQPFGGFKLSGVGAKAGGPDYLLQFLEPKTVSENTMRRGFSPDTV